MSNQIKMTDGELSEVRTLQEKFQNKLIQLGQMYLHKIQTDLAIKNISEQEPKVVADWESLQKDESDLIDSLLKKYGEGSLDLKAGIFISDEKSPTSS